MFSFCREKREEEIEFFMMKKYNKLGGKIQTKTTQLDNLITDPKLVLKWCDKRIVDHRVWYTMVWIFPSMWKKEEE